MFTGLIESTAKVENFSKQETGASVTFSTGFNDVKIGDSIAVNGACLTIVENKNGLLTAQIMPETLKKTNLNSLKKNDVINLERALLATSRLDGHLVLGHVDSLAKVQSITPDGFSKRITFNSNTDLIVQKGSIAINGVSLTVSNVSKDSFEVSLIPLTLNSTNLCYLKQGDFVNIEFDITAKYLYKFSKLKDEKKFKITEEFLKENGF